MKKFLAIVLAAAMLLSILAGCGATKTEEPAANAEPAATDAAAAPADKAEGRKELTMWFWGTSDYQRTAMEKYLVEGFNNSQDEYTLSVEYRSSVDSDIAVALSGGGGPDIVYGSGPAFVAGYAAEGLFVNLDTYAEQYGWKDRLVGAFYDLCTVNGSLYSIPGGMCNYGIFYNKAVLADLGYEVPTTYEELTTIMDAAIEAGLYGGLIGAKDWRYTNEWPINLLMTSVAGPEAVYKCLTGEQKWNSPEMVEAVNELVVWNEKGYMGGDDYWNLDANEIFQYLMAGQTPFCFAPLNGFQWAKNVAASDDDLADIGFALLPSKSGADAPVTLGAVCSLSVNAKCANPDGAAAVLDYMLTSEFATNMSSEWPGYWGLPVADFVGVDPASYEGVYRAYIEACSAVVAALNSGNFGYAAATCFPAQTYEACIDIDTVWFGDETVEGFLDAMDAAYAKDVESGAIAAIPKPNF